MADAEARRNVQKNPLEKKGKKKEKTDIHSMADSDADEIWKIWKGRRVWCGIRESIQEEQMRKPNNCVRY